MDIPAPHAAALADLSARTRIKVAGADRKRFLHNLCTNDILKLETGRGCEAFLLDPKGRVVDHVRIFDPAGSLWLDAEPARAQVLLAHLDRYLIREAVVLSDRTPTHCQFHLAGPKAGLVLDRIYEPAPTEPAIQGISLWAMECGVAGQACQIRRHPRSIEGGYDIIASREDGPAIMGAIQEAGRDLGLETAGPELMEIWRIEAGLPTYGIDIGPATIPQEVGRTALAISFTKGCYLGQETVARLDAMGHVNKVLCGLLIESARPAGIGSPILFEGNEVGVLTSSAISPRFGAIGLATLRVQASRPGTKLTVHDGPDILAATASPLPFA